MNELEQFSNLLLPSITKIQRLYSLKLDQELKAINLTLSEFRIVGLLLGEKIGYSQKELAKMLGITAASLSTSIQKLSSKNLIEQVNDPEDKRIKRIRTAPNLNLTKIQEILSKLEQEALAGICPDKLTITREVVQQILSNSNPKS